MVKMGVRQQNQVNPRQVTDTQAGPLDALEQEEPIGEIRVNQDIEVRKLDEKRGVANPSDRHFAHFELGKNRMPRPAVARGKPGLEHQLPEKSARIEMFCRRQLLE